MEKKVENSLGLETFKLQSLNINNKQLQDKKSIGAVQYHCLNKGELEIIARTGFKKDLVISDSGNGNYKRLLLKGVKNGQIPFYINKKEMEGTGINVYGSNYLLRETELKSIGGEGIQFGFWPEGLKRSIPITKSVIECSFLYSEKKGTFFSGPNNQEFFLPRSQSQQYYSRKINKRRYFMLLKELRLVLNLVILNLKNINVEGVLALRLGELKILIKRVMVLRLKMVNRSVNLITLLERDSWLWRYNFLYLHKYIIELSKQLEGVEKVLIGLAKLNLNSVERRRLLYSLNKEQLSGFIGSDFDKLSSKVGRLTGYSKSASLEKKYFFWFVNEVLKRGLEDELVSKGSNIGLSFRDSVYRVHLVTLINHFFKKSVVSVRFFEKVHRKIWKKTGLKGIRGFIRGRRKKKRKYLRLVEVSSNKGARNSGWKGYNEKRKKEIKKIKNATIR